LPGLFTGVAVVVIALSMPVAVGGLQARAESYTPAQAMLLPAAGSSWSGPAAVRSDWAPQFSGFEQEYSGTFRDPSGSVAVDVYVISYPRQKQDAELINSENRLFDVGRWTRLRHRSGVFESSGGGLINYLQDELQGARGDNRLVRYWYVVDGEPRYRPAAIKLHELKNSLLGRPTPASLVAISAPFRDEPATARSTLDAFIRDVYAKSYPLE